MSLKDEGIQQSGLSVMQMTNDSYIPHKLGERGHIEEEGLVESSLWHILLFYGPFSGLYRSDDRLCERLCIFFVDESFDILTVHVGRGRVILFIFVEDYSFVDGLCDRRRVISATG